MSCLMRWWYWRGRGERINITHREVLSWRPGHNQERWERPAPGLVDVVPEEVEEEEEEEVEELGVSDGSGAGSESDSEELDGEAAGGEVEEEAIVSVYLPFRDGPPWTLCYPYIVLGFL